MELGYCQYDATSAGDMNMKRQESDNAKNHDRFDLGGSRGVS